MGGRASINNFSGLYEAGATGTLATAGLISTLVGGASRHDERLADVLLGELQQATRFEISGSTLQVYGPGGDGVRFEYAGFRAQ